MLFFSELREQTTTVWGWGCWEEMKSIPSQSGRPQHRDLTPWLVGDICLPTNVPLCISRMKSLLLRYQLYWIMATPVASL